MLMREWYYIRALLSGASWGGTVKAARADLENDTEDWKKRQLILK